MLAKEFIIEDQRFAKLVMGNVAIEKLWTGSRWGEGPAYFPAGKYLVWSDMDLQGRPVSCEHGDRCVSMIDHDGKTVVLAERYNGAG